MSLDTQYSPKEIESRWYERWEKLGLFGASNQTQKKSYTIVMPPPNVTGVLHMGHALMCTLEDVLIRYKRMQGFEALWVPGTDHAGIATQMVVERHILKEEKKTRHDLGREVFLKKVWEWKENSQNTILSQLRVMGSSCDWSRLHFTLDEDVSRAVRECFVRLHKDGLISQETAMIQWCPRCTTALSDLEVKFQETSGKLYHIRYRLKDSDKALIVATTRPETLLGDVALAVHPEDPRYKSFHGKKVILPILGRELPVIADSYVDATFGTGVLKITPAHDVNDYEVGKRHGLPIISAIDERAKMNEQAGPYQGLSREKARTQLVADLEAQGLLEKTVDHRHNVTQCDRCQTVLEPRLSRQWFVDAKVLAAPAIEAVEKGEIKIIPQEWEKTYFQWMRNIRPWCISRQLWWGHRIPVWYCEKGCEPIVAVETPTTCPKCKGTKLKQDEDVLDTWFSSGLWPFSTLGWPGKTKDLETFYPTDVLETGFDILFFWVARMIMLGIRMTGKIPFHTVYLHPIVRDEHGQKMSKTKGNVVDPLEIVRDLGADSLRFYFAQNAFHGRDVRVTESGLEGCHNFINKIWNATRFVLMHFGDVSAPSTDLKNEVNQWIWHALNETKREVNEALAQYRFFDASQRLYHFMWDEFCFWFIEFIKEEEELARRKKAKDATAVMILEETLRLLHPFMPFVTEELWQKLPVRAKSDSIMVTAYPVPDAAHVFSDTSRKIGRVCALVGEVRRLRGVHNVPPAKQIALTCVADAQIVQELTPFKELIRKLAKLSSGTYQSIPVKADNQVTSALGDLKIFIPSEELGNVEAEKEKQQALLVEKESALQRAEQKLQNARFMEGAPEAVRKGVQEQYNTLKKEIEAIRMFLKTKSPS